MRCCREDHRRSIDFSAVSNPLALSSAIAGLLSRRTSPMRQREIERWFRATPDSAIGAALTEMCGRGQIEARSSSLSRRRRVLEYSAPPADGWAA